MKIIKIRRLFQIVEEGESYESIIAFAKYPIEFFTEDMGNGHSKTSILKYAKILRIDLWLFILTFKWEKNAKKQ